VPCTILSSACRGLSALVLSVALAGPVLAANPDPNTAIEPAESLEGNFLSAYIAGASRDTAAAVTFFREAIKEDPRNAELLERAFVAFLADGATADAFRLAERIVARDPSNSLAQFTMGVRALRAKQYATARTALQKGGRGRAADLTATLLTAWAYAGAGEGRRALETADRLKGERAFTQFREYHAGLIADLTKNRTEAERRLKAAYDADHNTLQIVNAYGRFEARRGNRDAAKEIFEGFEKVLPRHPVVRAALEDLNLGRPMEPAVATAQEGAAEVLYGLGVVGSAQSDELTAIIYLRLALHLNPDHALALMTLADVYERLKQYDRANEVLARIPKDSPLHTSAQISIGTNYELLGRGEEAVTQLEQLLKEQPDDVDVISSLANVLRSRKRWAEAAEVTSRAIAHIGEPQPGHWLFYFQRGTSYERAKQWDKAEPDLKKALELVPDARPSDRAQVLNYLAYSWVDMGTNIDDAFKMLQRAVELSPRDGMVIDSLGWAYYRLGRYDDAVRELERAVELRPGDPVLNDHLGDAYWKVGRQREAKFQWNHARDSNPEHEDLVRILRKIDYGLDHVTPAAADRPVAPTGTAQNGG
jgi:tetratricopeptide (TPR) repeat protein